MDLDKLAQRIATRKALGLSAEEYNCKLAQERLDAKRNKQRAIQRCLLVGMRGTQEEVDLALAELGRAEMAEASYNDSPIG